MFSATCSGVPESIRMSNEREEREERIIVVASPWS
jgi:O-glycosyl hydrolase